jgi:subtilase family serine protease
MNIFAGVMTRGRRLLVAAAVVATVGAFAFTQAKPASADMVLPGLNKADLTVSMTAQEQHYPTGGIAARMRIVVKNQGFKNAGTFQVSVRDQNNVLKQSFTINGLAAGASTVLYHQLPNFDCGDSYTRIARADSGFVISESNENNNTAQVSYIYPTC